MIFYETNCRKKVIYYKMIYLSLFSSTKRFNNAYAYGAVFIILHEDLSQNDTV